MRDRTMESVCGVQVVLDPVLTRRLRHKVMLGSADSQEAKEAIATHIARGEWQLLADYGAIPQWVFAVDDSDPLRVVELRFDVLLLHVFGSAADRDEYLDRAELNPFEDLSSHLRKRMPERSSGDPFGFTVGSSS